MHVMPIDLGLLFDPAAKCYCYAPNADLFCALRWGTERDRINIDFKQQRDVEVLVRSLQRVLSRDGGPQIQNPTPSAAFSQPLTREWVQLVKTIGILEPMQLGGGTDYSEGQLVDAIRRAAERVVGELNEARRKLLMISATAGGGA